MSANFNWEDFITIEEHHEESDPEESIDVEDVMLNDHQNLDISTNLQYQNILISYISSYYNIRLIKNCDGELQIVSKILDWIAGSSKYLANKINQSIIEPNNGEIKRSSYQFCDETVYCNKFYNQDSITCTSHHYVHSMVYADTKSIVNFLEKKNSLNETELLNIKKSIDTIKFVIDHMLTEFSGLESYMHQTEIYHRDNLNFAGKNRKKFKTVPLKMPARIVSSSKIYA